MIKIIKIVDQPKYIIVSKVGDNYFQYHMNNSDSRRYEDIGMWKIKQKTRCN